MLQMGVQVTFAWLGPLRVLSGVLITGVVRHNRCSINCNCKKKLCGLGRGGDARLQGEMQGFLDLGVPFDRTP